MSHDVDAVRLRAYRAIHSVVKVDSLAFFWVSIHVDCRILKMLDNFLQVTSGHGF